jgi:hypothetical protein
MAESSPQPWRQHRIHAFRQQYLPSASPFRNGPTDALSNRLPRALDQPICQIAEILTHIVIWAEPTEVDYPSVLPNNMCEFLNYGSDRIVEARLIS